MNQALESTVEKARIASVVQSRAYVCDALGPVGIDDTVVEMMRRLGRMFGSCW